MTPSLPYDGHFLREAVVDVHAAVVGISRARWTSVPAAEATPDRARDIMTSRRLDILPITEGASRTEYFTTETWNDHSAIRGI